MAITARFTADFSQFEASLKSASVTINAFEKGVKSAAADLNRLASSLSGANIQREAATIATAIESIGGAAKLTTAEATKMIGPIDQAIAKYKALGQQVPPELEKIQKELGEVAAKAKQAGDSAGGLGAKFKSELAGVGAMVAGAFTVTALINFGKELVDLGGQITDTANKLGISTEAVQEFEYAANSTGSSVDTFASAMARMQDKLAENSKATATLLADLNLTAEALRSMGTAEAFTTLAEVIKTIPDPMEQTRVAMELFGKAGVEALPAIRSGMADLRQVAQDTNQVIGAEGVKALDDFGDMWDQTYKRLQVGTASTVVTLKNDFGSISDTAKTVMVSVATVFFKPFGDKMRQAQLETRALEEAIARLPEVKVPAAFGADTGARGRANAQLAADQERLIQLAKDKAQSDKDAAAAAKSHADEIKKLRDQLSGAALQGDIRKLDEAWKGLSRTQQTSTEVLKRLVPQLEDMVKAGGKLPPALQKIYEEQRKLLPVNNDLAESFRRQIIVLGNYSQAAERAANRTKGLRDDGLLPVSRSFAGYNEAIDTAYVRTNNLAGQFRNAADAAADFERQAKNLTKLELGKAIGEAIGAGLMASDNKVAAVMGNLGQVGVQAFTSSMQSGITAAVSAGTMTAGMGMLAMTGVGLMAAGFYVAIQDMIAGIGEGERLREARLAGNAVREQFMQGFGGPEAFAEFAKRAGASVEQLTPFTVSAGTMEDMQLAIAEISPVLQDFIDKLEGLAVAGEGVNRFAAGLGEQFGKAFEPQVKALEDSQKAMLEYEKANGASAERIAELQKKFAEDSKNQIFAVTAENIDRVNNLGLMIGGVIANTAARTGDLVGAIKAVGPALTTLDALRDKADLKDQLTPATQQVLMLYDTVSQNEDAFNAIAGIGQMMTGLGEAMVANTPLANAFGQELAAQFTILRDRGVDAGVALSSMAPQLQELWELSKEGRVTVDETTQALLDQAEAAGVVGADMMDANEQIVSILTEIRDLFAESLPAGMLETGKSARGLAEQMGPDLKTAAQTGTQAITTGSQQQQKAIKDAQIQAQTYAKQLGPGVVEAAGVAGSAIDALGRKRIVIPVDFEMGDLPEYAGGAPEGSGAGSTTVNVNLDGETIARATAPHIPGVVEAYGVS